MKKKIIIKLYLINDEIKKENNFNIIIQYCALIEVMWNLEYSITNEFCSVGSCGHSCTKFNQYDSRKCETFIVC